MCPCSKSQLHREQEHSQQVKGKTYSLLFGTCETALGVHYGHWHRHKHKKDIDILGPCVSAAGAQDMAELAERSGFVQPGEGKAS